IGLRVADLDRAAAFWAGIGMRIVEQHPSVVVLELRGGTHMVLLPDDSVTPGDAPFDLLVDDLDATHAAFTKQGLAPSAIDRG
ncbi:VOC family protein, partial [Salmonella sp. SAL4437]|uniref:VOC family protein n=1 Tax=Salmonella sp. SAL4437 TaxID=3159892 RepID=UPI00397A884F